MAKVELYKLQNDGSQEVIVTCRLVDNAAVCEGNTNVVEKLNTKGILNYAKNPPETIFPSDGQVFLEQMKFNFKSGYLNASDIIGDPS